MKGFKSQQHCVSAKVSVEPRSFIQGGALFVLEVSMKRSKDITAPVHNLIEGENADGICSIPEVEEFIRERLTQWGLLYSLNGVVTCFHFKVDYDLYLGAAVRSRDTLGLRWVFFHDDQEYSVAVEHNIPLLLSTGGSGESKRGELAPLAVNTLKSTLECLVAHAKQHERSL